MTFRVISRAALAMVATGLLFCAGCEGDDEKAKPANIAGVWSGQSKNSFSAAQITLTLEQNGSAISGTIYVETTGNRIGIVSDPSTSSLSGTYSAESGILEITYTSHPWVWVKRYDFDDDNTMVLISETAGGRSDSELDDEVLHRQ